MSSNPGSPSCYELGGTASSINSDKFLSPSTQSNNEETTKPLSSYSLSDSEKTLIQSFVEKLHILIQLSSAPDSMYEKTLSLIETYLAEFTEQGDAKKSARAEELLNLLKSWFSQK